MTFKLDPRRCPICGHNRGYGQPDHTDCARKKQLDNAERNAKREPLLKRVRDKVRAGYLNGSKKRWWPD